MTDQEVMAAQDDLVPLQFGSGDAAAVQTEVEPAAAPAAAAADVEQVDDLSSGEAAVEAPVIVGGSTPSEASTEWPSDRPITIVTYYLVKLPIRTAPEELKLSNSQLKDKTDKRDTIAAAVAEKKATRQKILDQLQEPRSQVRACKSEIAAKVDEMKPFQEKLSQLMEKNKGGDIFICDSERDLDNKIVELDYSIQHGTLNLREEKQVLRQIQSLKNSRQFVIARSELRQQMQPFQEEIDELKKRRDLILKESQALEDKCSNLSNELKALEGKKAVAADGVYEQNTARKNLNDKNNDHFRFLKDLKAAKQHAANHNKAAVEELCTNQVEEFLGQWNSDKQFRMDYVKNNMASIRSRFTTLDGRTVKDEVSSVTAEKPGAKQAKDEPAKAKQAKDEPVKVKQGKDEKAKAVTRAKPAASVPKEVTTPKHAENNREAEADVEKEVDESHQLELERENRRRESIEKAKEAELRKKKLADKKAAKNLVRQEKEKQRKELEKEKKQRKKAAANGVTEETVANSLESENGLEDGGEATPVENGVATDETREETVKAEAPSTRRRRGGGKQGKSVAVRPPLKKKRSLQRQIFDNWQMILAAVLIILVVAGASMMFVRV